MTIQSRSPELEELIRDAIDFALRDVHVALPARVESFDAEKQTCSVQPLVKRRDFAAGSAQRLPVINEVPVVFPRAGGYSLTFPLQKGDTVLLVFSHRSLDKWSRNGDEADPGDIRHHHINDAVAVPGLHDAGHPIKDFQTDGVVLQKEGGASIKVKDDDVTVTADGTVNVNGGNVVVNNGSSKVARVGDSAKVGTLAAAYTGGTVELTYTAPDGTVTVGASVTLVGELDSGAEHFKG